MRYLISWLALIMAALMIRPARSEDGVPFTADRFRAHAGFLAADDLKGRAAGTPGAFESARYIAERLREWKLAPLGDRNTFFQEFTLPDGAKGRNVLALLPGAGAFANQYVIVSAHYDHIGTKTDPDGARSGGDLIFNGADDDASGVAAVLLIAEGLARDRDAGRLPASRRGVVFAAFDAEESGLLGARHYAENPPIPLARTSAVLNFDMVGRLEYDRFYAIDAESSPEVAALLKGLEKECRLSVETRISGGNRSDALVFLERRVPAIHFLTGIHPDYHQVSDELERLNCDGGAAIARLGCKLAQALTAHNGPIHFRKVDPTFDIQHALALVTRLGMIPELNSQDGRHPRVNFVIPGSQADRRGLKRGDQIKAINGARFARVEEAMLIFSQLSLEDGLRLTLLRDGKEQEVTVPGEVFASFAGPSVKPMKDGRYEVTFRFSPPADAGDQARVYLAGTFNDWQPNATRMDGPDARRNYTAKLILKRGTYEYKFVVEGRNGRSWHFDSSNLHQAGEFGNSVLWVGPKPSVKKD